MRRRRNKKINQVDAILTSDWHLRPDTPTSRTDDYQKAMWKKVEFIIALSRKHQCPILHAGDMFHKPNQPSWLIEEFMRLINKSIDKFNLKNYTQIDLLLAGQGIICVAGQHDLPAHNLNNWHKSALGAMTRASYTIPLGATIYNHWSSNVFNAKGFSFGQELEHNPDEDFDVAIIHKMVIEDKPEWPGQVADSAISILKKYPLFKLIITGDNHRPFTAEYKGQLLVNPGSMMRMTAAQIVHKPRVYLWNAKENSVEVVYLPIEKDVLNRSHIDKRQEIDERIAEYTERLKIKFKAGINFKENLESHFQNTRTRRQVKERVWEACDN